MCLTLLGKTKPVEDLCGAHGQCIDNICICDKYWENSLDFMSLVDYGSGGSEVFYNLTEIEDFVSVDAYKNSLLQSAPCTRYEPLMTVSILQKKRQRFRIVHIFRTLGFLIFMIYAILKISLGKQANYPFTLSTSILFSCFKICKNSTIYFYFYKHASWQIVKARQMYSLRVTAFGIDLELFFQYQKKFAAFYDIFIFSSLYFVAPFVIEFLRDEEDIEFESLRSLQTI
eukprot:snap_masked-scaffold_17-processed-gene-3.28-mRNA-1 protein AED:1.00 eAED:1.00 QI:0/0/0/0/1/1/3/0/228